MKKIYKISLVMIILFAVLQVYCYAADMVVSKSSITLNVGETTTFNVTPDDAYGRVDFTSNNTGIVTLDKASSWIENSAETVTVTAVSAGNTTIKVVCNDVTQQSNNDIEINNTHIINVTVNAPEPPPQEEPEKEPEVQPEPEPKLSSNNYLKMLGYTPNDFHNFTPANTTYYTTVPYEVSKVNVYADKQESSQMVSGTGVKSLNVGENTLEVICTAEDGSQRTYTMYVTREEYVEEVVEEVIEEPKEEQKPQEEDNIPTEETEVVDVPKDETEQVKIVDTSFDITSLSIIGYNDEGKFTKFELVKSEEMEDVGEYIINASIDITRVEITADSSIKLEILGDLAIKEGENVITIIASKGDNTKIFRVVINKNEANPKASIFSDDVIMQLMFIAICAAVIIVGIGSIIAIVSIKSRKKGKHGESENSDLESQIENIEKKEDNIDKQE